jgi:hypothetical protein
MSITLNYAAKFSHLGRGSAEFLRNLFQGFDTDDIEIDSYVRYEELEDLNQPSRTLVFQDGNPQIVGDTPQFYYIEQPVTLYYFAPDHLTARGLSVLTEFNTNTYNKFDYISEDTDYAIDDVTSLPDTYSAPYTHSTLARGNTGDDTATLGSDNSVCFVFPYHPISIGNVYEARLTIDPANTVADPDATLEIYLGVFTSLANALSDPLDFDGYKDTDLPLAGSAYEYTITEWENDEDIAIDLTDYIPSNFNEDYFLGIYIRNTGTDDLSIKMGGKFKYFLYQPYPQYIKIDVTGQDQIVNDRVVAMATVTCRYTIPKETW